jgi:hypothetical protein
MNAGQSSKKTKGPEDSYFPLDIAAVLAPVLLAAVLVYVTCAISWAKAFGDTSLLNLALWLGGIGAAMLLVARIPLYRQRRFFTLGPKSLAGIHRKLYYLAYLLIVPSIVLLALLLMTLK